MTSVFVGSHRKEASRQLSNAEAVFIRFETRHQLIRHGSSGEQQKPTMHKFKISIKISCRSALKSGDGEKKTLAQQRQKKRSEKEPGRIA
jgi:hypothetical protein